jgi:hypothetical protein
MGKIAAAFVAVLALALPAQALARIDGLDPAGAGSPKTAAEALAADPSQVSGASLPEYAFGGGGAPSPIGVGNSEEEPPPKSLVGFPTQGITYAILSSGKINDIASMLSNESNSTSTDFPEQKTALGIERGPEANDWTVLKADFKVPGGANCLALDYRFLSEEFPEFVESPFNDAFIAEIDGTKWSVGESGEISRPIDFASSPEGEPISVNGVGPIAVTEGEASGTYFDAATGLITTKTPISSGAHSIYLSIFDASDGIYDSAVFLDNLRFINESPETCKPPTTKQLAVPPAGTPAPPSNVFTVGPSVKFKSGGTKAVLTVIVPGPGTLTAASGVGSKKLIGTASRASVSKKKGKKKKPLISPASVVATAAGPVQITIKLSASGKKQLQKKGKVKVPVTLTFTPTGGTPASQVVNVTFRKKGKGKPHGGK